MDAVFERAPHRFQAAGEVLVELAHVDAAFLRAVEVRAARGEQVEFQRGVGVLDHVRGGVAAGDDLDAASAVRDELGDQRVLLGRREAVAAGVRDDGQPAGVHDPAHRVAQRRPAVRHVAGLALGEEAAEDLGHVRALAALHQETREVGAGDQLRIAGELERAFVGAGDADLGEAVGHLLRPRAAAAARGAQAFDDARIVMVEAQADDMHHLAGESHRDLGAGQIG